MKLEEIKARWNDVLDEILRQDRILWLAFFDARDRKSTRLNSSHT